MNDLLFASSIFPPLNASLNAISVVFLLCGFVLIKKGKKEAHKKSMMGALAASAAFLVCYLYYHYTAGHTTFPEKYPIARKVYLSILLPHVLLAIVNVPLVIITVRHAVKGNFKAHRKIAKVTFPIWMFVSVTGVIVYFMIYQWFPA